MNVSSNSIAKGRAIRRQISGDDTPRTAANAGAFSLAPDIEDWVLGSIFGEIWSRPQLEPKVRSIVTLTLQASIGASMPLRGQLHVALTLGWTPREITEMFIQLMPYGGAPRAVLALDVANEFFIERNLVDGPVSSTNIQQAGTDPIPGIFQTSPASIEAGKATRLAMGGTPTPRSASMVLLYDMLEGFEDFLTGSIFGEIWSRDGLSLRYRSIVVVTSLVYQGRDIELEAHMGYALNLGWTPSQIIEVLLHALPYCGAPSTIGAMRVAHELFTERGLL